MYMDGFQYKVYCHTSPNNKRYVGISINPEKRWANGEGYIKNYQFYPDIQKYGWNNFKHEILYENLSIEEAKEKERTLIKEWDLMNPLYGYNLTEGGDGAFSEYSRYLMSKSRKGNVNSKGQIHTPENRKQISESLKKYYAAHPKKDVLDLNNPEIQAIIKRREEQAHINRSKAISGANNPSAKAIIQYDLEGHVLNTFPYATMAAKQFNIDLSGIIKCCRGKSKTAGGYRWSYLIE